MQAMTKKQSNDFLQPLLELMQKNAARQDDRIDILFEKIENNTELTNQVLSQAQKTNGRVTKTEKAIARLERVRGRKLPEVSSNVIYLLALGFLVLLLIIAKLLHIDIGGFVT